MDKPWAKRNVRRRKADIHHKLRLKRMYEDFGKKWYPGITEEFDANGNIYYKPHFGLGDKGRFFKKYASRRVRQARHLSNGSHYKKVYDLWCELD